MIPIYNPSGTVVGTITAQEHSIYMKKKVVRDKHMLHQPKGWATDSTHIHILEHHAENLGLPASRTYIQLTVDKGSVWTADAALFRTHGIGIDRGFGEQIVLPEKHWQRVDANRPRLF